MTATIAIVAIFAAAWLLRLVPWYEPVGVLVYLMAAGVAATVALRLYPALVALHSWTLGRWLARCVTGSVAMVGFVAVFIGSGYGSLLNRRGDDISWSGGVVLGVVMGIAYATLLTIGYEFPRRRRK